MDLAFNHIRKDKGSIRSYEGSFYKLIKSNKNLFTTRKPLNHVFLLPFHHKSFAPNRHLSSCTLSGPVWFQCFALFSLTSLARFVRRCTLAVPLSTNVLPCLGEHNIQWSSTEGIDAGTHLPSILLVKPPLGVAAFEQCATWAEFLARPFTSQAGVF